MRRSGAQRARAQPHTLLPTLGAPAHRTDVRELLGAHIVGVHDERLVIGVQVLAEAGVVLRSAAEGATQPGTS